MSATSRCRSRRSNRLQASAAGAALVPAAGASATGVATSHGSPGTGFFTPNLFKSTAPCATAERRPTASTERG